MYLWRRHSKKVIRSEETYLPQECDMILNNNSLNVQKMENKGGPRNE